MALDGGLGKYFPIDKLPVLAEQTAKSVKYHRTLRWNVHTGHLEYEMVANLQEMLPYLEKAKSYEPVLTAVKQCVEFINPPTAQTRIKQLAKIAQDEWDKHCNLEPFKSRFPELNKKAEDLSESAALVQKIVFLTIQTSYARGIRETLGVAKDDEQILKQRSCPAP